MRTPSPRGDERRRRVCIVGPSPQLLGGVTYYVHSLLRGVADRARLSVVLLGNVQPRRWHQGISHAGVRGAELDVPAGVDVFSGLDWTVVPSLPRSLRFMRRQRTEVLVLVHWTARTLHTYLALALYARLTGCEVILDLHGEASPPRRNRWRARAAHATTKMLLRLADHVVVHDEADRAVLIGGFHVPPDGVTVLEGGLRHPRPWPEPVRFLFFGGIDEFKGVRDLVAAFDAISMTAIDQYELLLAGAPYDDFPIDDVVRSSRHRNRITLDARWIPDDEVEDLFAQADVVVLPYRAPWTAGPLELAERMGKPVVMNNVAGFADLARGYAKLVLAEPGNVPSLLVAMERAAALATEQRDTLQNPELFAGEYLRLLGIAPAATVADGHRVQRRTPAVMPRQHSA